MYWAFGVIFSNYYYTYLLFAPIGATNQLKFPPYSKRNEKNLELRNLQMYLVVRLQIDSFNTL